MLAGELYVAADPELVADREACERALRAYNAEGDEDERARMMRELLGAFGDESSIRPPFFCDYGSNIHLGKRVFFNFNCVVLDVCPVRIGSFTLFGPAVQVYTPMHPFDAELRPERSSESRSKLDRTYG